MVNEYSSEQVARTSSLTRTETKMIEMKVRRFLDLVQRADPGILCSNCPTRYLCGPVIVSLSGALTSREAADNTPLLFAHGIDTGVGTSGVCPGKLVGTVTSHVDNEAFWISKVDPLLDSDLRVQYGESVMFAIQGLITKVKNGERL